ncbi:MAG: phosphatidylglycerol lysyltransferase domain-containing protein [Clostridia bacterium]|nr:phosphatidylglycerol lysyltransferase domain-containing protein [Clostridia bacterium]
MDFHDFTVESAAALRPLFGTQTYRACDYTMGANFQWRGFYRSAYAVADGMLIIRGEYMGAGPLYMLPVGTGDLAAAFGAIERDAAERGLPLVYFTPGGGLGTLRERYGARIEREEPVRYLFDYLYDIRSMQTFAGKKMHGQKNHLNRFLRENPEAEFVPVTAETLPEAERFLEDFEREAGLTAEVEVEEMTRARETLHAYEALGLSAGFIRTEKGVAALAAGEVVGDTLYVHIEKARVSFHGAYQAIASMYPRYAAKEDTLYLNREDDSGDEGLRKSKLAYQPIGFTEKHFVFIRPE